MPLLGNAAMLLWYDIVPEQIAEHDDWHTREHFPERLGIPGFLRAQRWVSEASPRNFVVYDVSDVGILSSAPYLTRLNNPTPWTSRTMPHFRGMTRGFCKVVSSHGTVLGTSAITVRFSILAGEEERMLTWLEQKLLPGILERKGIASAIIFKSDAAPEMTAEQRIRGRDAGVDWVLLVTGYSAAAIKELVQKDLDAGAMTPHGAAAGVKSNIYQLACSSDRTDMRGGP